MTATVHVGYSPTTVKLATGEQLHFYYANNKGRGRNNVTIYRVDATTPRLGNCRLQEMHPYVAMTRTSGWAGDVNFSRRIQTELGL